MLTLQLAACKPSFEKTITDEKWKVYSGGNEVTYEFYEDGTGQYSYNKYTPTKFRWEIDEDELALVYDDSKDVYDISEEDGVNYLKRQEERPLFSNEYVLVRESDFEEMYDFEDRLISMAEFDVFLIYNSNFSHGSYVDIYITDIENFNDTYTVSGSAQYKDANQHTYTGSFEIQYYYNGEEIVEIDNNFSRPRS